MHGTVADYLFHACRIPYPKDATGKEEFLSLGNKKGGEGLCRNDKLEEKQTMAIWDTKKGQQPTNPLVINIMSKMLVVSAHQLRCS
jgi:hypothetical protein